VGGIVAELRDRRLWPVAVALLVALVAIPVALSRSARHAPNTHALRPGLPISTGSAPGPPVTVANVPAQMRLGGLVRDPFTPQHHSVPSPVGMATATASAGAGPGSGGANGPGAPGGGAGSSASGGTPVSSSDTGGGSAAPSPPPSGGSASPASGPVTKIVYVVASADLSFRKAGGAPRIYGHVARLTPLPSASNPLVLFLGMKSDRRTAVFLLSSQVSASGPGRCIPSRLTCEFLELQPGQRETLLALNPGGSTSRYYLKLLAAEITTEHTQNQYSHGGFPRAGSQVFAQAQRTSAPLQSVPYSPTTGLLSDGAIASASGGGAASLAVGFSTGVTLEPPGGGSQ